MRLLIFCFIILIVSCYKDNSKEVDDGVYARVGSIELTQKDLVLFDNKTPGLGALNSKIKVWIDETVLFSEAVKNGFENDEVLVSGTSFISSVNSIIYCNGIPHFLDIEPEAFSIDLNKLEKKITSKTKVIIPTHLNGSSANIPAIKKIIKKKKIYIIEDAGQALFSKS